MAISLAQFREKQVPILLKSEKDRHAIVLDNGYQTQNLHLAPELANAIKAMRTTCEHDGAITDLDRLVGKIEQYIGQNTIDLGVYTQIGERLKELHDYFYNHGAIFQVMTPHINALIDKIEHFYGDGIEAAPNAQDIFKFGLDSDPEIILAKEMLAKAGIKEELDEASVITPTKYSKPFYDTEAKKWIMRKTHVQKQDIKQVAEAEGDKKGMAHLTQKLAKHISQQIDKDGIKAIEKSIEWGDGASVELLTKIKDMLDDYASTIEESAAWQRKEGKNETGGLNAKGVASYRKEHPGSKLQMAVTTKPSKLDPDSKAAKRRKSFCARMGGMAGPMKDEKGKPTRKALALKKWNCESVEEFEALIESYFEQTEELAEAVKQRLDATCWEGKHKEGTKIKGGIRVNNCVPNVKEDLDEAESNVSLQRAVDYHTKEAKYHSEKAKDIKKPIKKRTAHMEANKLHNQAYAHFLGAARAEDKETRASHENKGYQYADAAEEHERKHNLMEATSPIAGTRLVKKYGDDANRAEVRYNPDYQEYQVHHYKDGKHMGEGPVSYHGDDKQDAHDTAKSEVAKRSTVKEELDESLNESADAAWDKAQAHFSKAGIEEKKSGKTEKYHHLMSLGHDHLSEYHAHQGHSRMADHHANQAEYHHEESLKVANALKEDLDEAHANPDVPKIRKILGAGKSYQERGRGIGPTRMSHSLDPEEAKSRLAAAGFTGEHIKHSKDYDGKTPIVIVGHKKELDEAMHRSDVPAFLRKAKKEEPLTTKEVKDQGKENLSHKETLEKNRNVNEDIQVLDESLLTEGEVSHGKYLIKTGPHVSGMGEDNPEHVKGHLNKLKSLGVPVEKGEKYGKTTRVSVKNTETGDTTHHHVYQRQYYNDDKKPIVSVRNVGAHREKQAEHHAILKDYLSGKKPTVSEGCDPMKDIEVNKAIIKRHMKLRHLGEKETEGAGVYKAVDPKKAFKGKDKQGTPEKADELKESLSFINFIKQDK